MTVFKKWIYIFSPCILGVVFLLVEIVKSFLDIEESEGYSGIVILLLVPISLALFTIDRMTKYFIKKPGDLWLLQVIVLLIVSGVFYWIKL